MPTASACACRSRAAAAPVEIDSRRLPGKVTAAGPAGINPSDYDLVALAMQEPQYRSPGVRELLDAVAKSGKPCMSIMNMPPLPYLKRIRGLNTDGLHHCFTDASVWANFDPGRLTLCSPDPQAIRMPDDKINVLTVTLPTNFKAARFDSDESTNIMRQFQREIEAIRFDAGDAMIDLPVKLKVHESIFVPLAKWAMLCTGNYRCVKPDAAVSIKEAVHADIEASRRVYDWVRELCMMLGASTGRSGAVREIRSGSQRSDPPIVRRACLCSTAHRTSNAWTGWCRASRRSAACAMPSWMRRWHWSTPGWR